MVGAKALSLLTGSALLLGLFGIAPQQTQAVEGDCASIVSGANENLAALQEQSAELASQISDVDAKIAELELEYSELQDRNKELIANILDLMRRESILDRSSTDLDALVSSQSLSKIFQSETYKDAVGDELDAQYQEFLENEDKLNEAIEEAKESRQGLLELKSQHDQRQATMEAQAEAKRAAEQLEAEECRAAKEAEAQEVTSGVAENATLAQSGGSAPSFSGASGENPFPWGQCTYYVASQRGGWQLGNAGTWQPNSSAPGIGKIMIMRPYFGGANTSAGHVGIVVDIKGNQIKLQHMNWKGLGVVSTDWVPNSGLFIN